MSFVERYPQKWDMQDDETLCGRGQRCGCYGFQAQVKKGVLWRVEIMQSVQIYWTYFILYQFVNQPRMFGVVFDTFNKITSKIVGPAFRSIGKSMYLSGTKIEGDNASQDRLVPSLRNLDYGGAQPDLEAAEFIAPNCTILGKVSIGVNSSVWYGATLIGTKGIRIGNNCVVQDRSHLSSDVKIGDHVFIGPNSIIQGSELADKSFVAMGATVRHAKVQSGGFVAAGAVIGDNVIVKQGEIWAGNPGKFLRNITPVEREVLREHVEEMRDLAVIHAEETEKNAREVISGKTEPFETAIFEDELQNMFKDTIQGEGLPVTENDDDFIERRTIMREDIKMPHTTEDYEPYDYNISYMGQKFNLGVHNEAYKKVATKIEQKERFGTDQDPWTKPF